MNETSLSSKVWKNPVSFWVLLGVCALLVGYAFHETIVDMVQRWGYQEEYGYGYIIPIITLFLIWQRKNSLMSSEFRPTYWAVPILLVSGLLYFAGAVSTTHTLSQYALVLTIMGLAFGFLGWEKFKVIAIPLALLFFMVPPYKGLEEK